MFPYDRIEETWRLWCKFLDDYSCFEDWLKLAERTAANPNSDNVPYTVAKEELKKFEVSFGGPDPIGTDSEVHLCLPNGTLVLYFYPML